MGEDWLPYFRLIFRELERFALPGVGSFVLRRMPARFSPDGASLEPPREFYEYLAQVDPLLVRETERFFAQRYSLDPSRAADLTEKVGRAVADMLAAGTIIRLPAVGTLKKSGGATILDVSGVETLLEDLKLSPGVSVPAAVATQPASTPPPVAQTVVSESNVFVEPPPKSNFYVYLYGILLILGAIGIMVGVFYYNKSRNVDPPKAVREETVVVAVRDTPKVVGAESDTNTAKNSASSSPSPPPSPAPAAVPPSPRTTLPPLPPADDQQGGAFHIIVASAGDWAEASSRETLWKNKGFRVELLPGKDPGTYRISVASAPTREAAERKLALLKNQGRIPLDAWVLKAY
ncbi:MAG: hypothetical protein NZ534_02850 [Bacteroidia bacterium]|nr:hypothetical protein [Bacteroidia bacterium]